MTVHVNYERVTAPTAYVTKDRQRVKQNNDVVYLNNGDEFEIELFNPTSKKVLAKILINEISLGSGIVLRPGERVFLERYLDEAKKFVFETYEVDKANPNVQRAIRKNGIVDVEFYDEIPPRPQHIWRSPTITYDYNQWYVDGNNTYSGSINIGSAANTNICGESDLSDITFNCCNISGDADFTANTKSFIDSDMQAAFEEAVNEKANEKVETGRIEKGDNSKQKFVYDNTEFMFMPTWTSSWKILPMSQKAYVKEDLIVHCTQCGAKRKKTFHKFCPNCGNQY